MGITGLLPKLASITTNLHIKELSGLTIAVDAYVWLHRGAYSCSRELCEGVPTDKYARASCSRSEC
jgi:exonuclease-1